VIQAEPTEEYRHFLDLVSNRSSIGRLKPDPVPDEYIDMVLDAARWAMSGANSQPWEFIVVKDREIKRQLYEAYRRSDMDLTFWMEQQRILELRHPGFQINPTLESRQQQDARSGWQDVPVLICIIGDGRRQWGTVASGQQYGLHQSHLTDGLANVATLIHLAGAALGLGSGHTTIHVEEPFKRLLGMPPYYAIHDIVPMGWPAVDPRVKVRRSVEEMVHRDRFDPSKKKTNQEVIEWLYALRKKTIPQYASRSGRELPEHLR
jgi:5,6-dimethylbenzimidazole synthase